MIVLRNWLELQLTRFYSRLVARSFKHCAPSRIHPAARIDNPQYIALDGVAIGRGVWLYAMTIDSAGRHYSPEITIGQGTSIGDYCHITCATRVWIGRDVLISQGVLITDSTHVYGDQARPISQQGLSCNPVCIGDGSWLGNHSAVLGCSVGRHCVVGTNAVVTRDVPDFCVVAGSPARVVKRYDAAKEAWVRTI